MLSQLNTVTLTQSLELDCGRALDEFTIAYETYGKLNADKTNAILVCHALTGNSHASGKYHKDDEKFGWWDNMIGVGKPIDTNEYFVVCSNVLGSCYGTTGPSSINPATNQPYHLDFPVITVADMVNVQRYLMDYLTIDCWLSVLGGSLGGMQALYWATAYPDRVCSIIPLATTAQTSPQAIAFDWVGRESIMSDKQFNKGKYDKDQPPEKGLATARMLGHITYLSRQGMSRKFGRRLQESDDFGFDFNYDFAIESYLNYQGRQFVEHFDANSYLYITRAMDYFHLANEEELKKITANILLISFSSDWLFPPSESEELVALFQKIGIAMTYCEIETDEGHDAFLLKNDILERTISSFLNVEYSKVKK